MFAPTPIYDLLVQRMLNPQTESLADLIASRSGDSLAASPRPPYAARHAKPGET